MSEFLMRRHTAAITRLQVDLDSIKLKLSTQVIKNSVSAGKEAGAAAKSRTVLLAEDTKRLIYLRTKHNLLWNQHFHYATKKWDIMYKDYPNQCTVSADFLLGEESVTFLPLPKTEHKNADSLVLKWNHIKSTLMHISLSNQAG